MRRFIPLLWLSLAACKLAPELMGAEEDVSVETLALELGPDGRGTLGFVLHVPGRERYLGTVVRVEWELELLGRAFAAGVSTASAEVPAGQGLRLELLEPLAYGTLSYEPKPRTLPVFLRGTLVTKSASGEERKRFEYRSRVATRGAPSWDR